MYPERESFKIPIIIENTWIKRLFQKEKVLYLEFQEATIQEIDNFFKLKTEREIISFYKDFIFKKTWCTKKEIKQIGRVLNDIIKILQQTYFISPKKEEKKNNSKISPPDSSFLVFICKEVWLHPDEYMKLTMRQLNYISEWVIYNIKQQTKEWRVENKKEDIKRMSDQEKQNLDNLFSKIKD